MGRTRELTKNTIIITIGRVSTQFISFLLLPLYTTLLSTEEYGTVDFITTLVSLLIPVFSLMIDQGVFRHLLNCQTDEEKKQAISSGFFVLAVTNACAVVLYFIINGFFSSPFKIWLLLILIVMSFSNFFLQVARGLKHTGDYALGSFISSASIIILNVLYIAILRMGAEGMLTATFAGNLICSLFLFIKLRLVKYISISSFKKLLSKNELKYSIPLVPNQLSLWVMNSSDRIIVTFFLGASANGILAVSHKFPTIYMTFYNIFQLAWHETGAIHYFDKDRDQFFSDMIKKIVTLYSTLCMGVIVILPLIFHLLARGDFSQAYNNIPIYLVASLFNVVIGLLGVIYVATKKTKEIAKTTIISAVINIIVNVALINYIGLYAASISTFVGYLVTMIYRIKDTKKYLKIKYDIKQIFEILLLILICCFLYYINNKIISLIFLPIFVILAYILNKSIIDAAIKVIEEKTGFSRKIIILISIVLLCMLSTVGCIFLYKKVSDKPKEIQAKQVNDIQQIKPEKTILFSEFGVDDFTCTGMTYDYMDNSYWICDYGAKDINEKVKPRIVEVDDKFEKNLRVIELESVLNSSANLQGVAYDGKENCFWLATGKDVVSVDKNGELLKTISIGKYGKNSPNGIAYNFEDDTLWILCASKYLLNINKDGTVIKEIPFNYHNQDHICFVDENIYVTVGADYNGENNYICKVDPKDGTVNYLYQTFGANSLEGICNNNNMIIVANDGLYHKDIVGHSYLTIYYLDGGK